MPLSILFEERGGAQCSSSEMCGGAQRDKASDNISRRANFCELNIFPRVSELGLVYMVSVYDKSRI